MLDPVASEEESCGAFFLITLSPLYIRVFPPVRSLAELHVVLISVAGFPHALWWTPPRFTRSCFSCLPADLPFLLGGSKGSILVNRAGPEQLNLGIMRGEGTIAGLTEPTKTRNASTNTAERGTPGSSQGNTEIETDRGEERGGVQTD